MYRRRTKKIEAGRFLLIAAVALFGGAAAMTYGFFERMNHLLYAGIFITATAAASALFRAAIPKGK